MPKPNEQNRDSTKPSGAARRAIDPEIMAAMIDQIPVIAANLRTARDREGMQVALVPITDLAEPEQVGFATTLGNQRGDNALAAADIAEALAELATDKAAAKEARRSVIRLRSAGVRPTIAVPRPALHDDTAEKPGAAAPEFIQGWASRTREKSEVVLGLAWTRPNEPGDIDGFVMTLNLWEGRIQDARHVEPMTQRRFEREVLAPIRDEQHFSWMHITLPQARALIEAALDQGAWRNTPPDPSWNEISAVIRRRIQRDDVQADDSVERLLLDPEAEAEETLVNFWGSWSFGDYALAYDLLADRNALREKETRAEFIALRRKWQDEAKPARIQIGAITPQAQEQSGIWLPGASAANANRRNYALFWSLEYQETPISGQLSEMPMATLMNPDSQRHWFWVSVSMERDAIRGGWKLARIRDEALAAQAQPVDELLQRSDALWQEAEAGAAAQPQSEEVAREAALKVIALAQESQSLGECALMRLPADRQLHERLHDHAAEIGLWDRAAAITHRMLAHFQDTARLQRDLALMDYRKAQSLAQGDDTEGAQRWLDFALTAARKTLELDRNAESLTLLAELLMMRGTDLDEAETLLRESIQMQPTVGAWADLGDILMQQQNYTQAVEAFENAQKLDPQSPQIRWRLGRALEAVDRQPEARLVYEDALAADENDAMAHALLGNILTDQEEFEAAKEHLTKALQLGLVSAQIMVQLAYNYAKLGDFTTSRALLEEAKRVDPSLTSQIDRLIAQVRAEEEQQGRRHRR